MSEGVTALWISADGCTACTFADLSGYALELLVFTRAVAVPLLAVALVTAVPVQPAAAADSTLTVAADKTGSTTFVLTRDSVVSVEGVKTSEQVEIRGRGRLFGVLLNRLGDGDQPSLLAYRTNLCKEPGCMEAAPDDFLEYVTGTGAQADDGTDKVALPAGTYAVTAFTDGAPMTATLILAGLDQATTLRPTGPAAVRYNTLDTALLPAGAPAGLAYSAGSTYATTRPSYAAYVYTSETVAGGAAQSDGACYYSDGPPLGGIYTNNCPAIDGSDRVSSGGFQLVQTTDGLRLGGYGAFGLLPADPRFSLGQYIYSALPIRNVFALQVLVEYGVAPTSAPAGRVAAPSPGAPAPSRPESARPQAAPQQLPATGGGPAVLAPLLLLLAWALLIWRRSSSRRATF